MSAREQTAVAFRFSSFDRLPLIHGMSGQSPDAPALGDMAHAPGTVPDEIEANRAAFLSELGIDAEALTIGRQTHGAGVAVVTEADRGRGRYPAFDGFPQTDGLITREPGIALGSIVADCTPILLYDPVHHALGLVHSGWRGTVAGIARRAVDEMRKAFGTNPAGLIAGIGPSIGGCCYEVGEEVATAWRESGHPDWESALRDRQPRPHFDLWRANQINLVAAGVPADQIEIAGHCTRCCGERYFSHRAAMAGERTRGRMIMVAQLLKR